MPKLKFKLPEIETQNLSNFGPVNNIEQIESSLSPKLKAEEQFFNFW